MMVRMQASPLNMPELNWRFGYLLVMGSMAGIALAMVAMFRRWGWIGGSGNNHGAAGNNGMPPQHNGESAGAAAAQDALARDGQPPR